MKKFLYSVFINKFWLKSIASFVLLILMVFGSNYYIVNSTKSQIISDINKVPTKKVAIVLGAAKKLNNGINNPYFFNRINAAAELYHAGKVSHFLVSGDNHTESYNESEDMMLALINLGVPESCITMDFAGFRTFDSMIRAKEIFGVTDCIIVSQEFHLQRALFIANSINIKAIGYPAKGVGYKGLNVREFGAKFKAALDCYLLPTQPRFLGKSEHIY
jgi:SanA protein